MLSSTYHITLYHIPWSLLSESQTSLFRIKLKNLIYKCLNVHHIEHSTFRKSHKPHFQVKKNQHRSFSDVFHLYSFLFEMCD